MSFEARWTEELPAETSFATGDRIVLNPGVELTAERVHVMRGVTFGADADAVYVQLLDTPAPRPTSRRFAALRAGEPGADDPFADDPSPEHKTDPAPDMEPGLGHGRVSVRFSLVITERLPPNDVPREGDRIQIEGRWFSVQRSHPVTTQHKASAHSIYDVLDYHAVTLVQETVLTPSGDTAAADRGENDAPNS